MVDKKKLSNITVDTAYEKNDMYTSVFLSKAISLKKKQCLSDINCILQNFLQKKVWEKVFMKWHKSDIIYARSIDLKKCI